MLFAFGEQVTRHPFATMSSNAHGRTTATYAADATVDGAGVGIDQSEETIQDGSTRLVETVILYLDYDQPATRFDEWTVRGNRYPVTGVTRERNPITGWEPGTVVTLRRVEG